MFLKRPVQQWFPLTALLLGFVGSAVGASFGQPNSWLWFGAGVLAAIVLVLTTRGLRTASRRSISATTRHDGVRIRPEREAPVDLCDQPSS